MMIQMKINERHVNLLKMCTVLRVSYLSLTAVFTDDTQAECSLIGDSFF